MSPTPANAPIEGGSITQVVDRGLCIGCGACAVATSGRIPVSIGRFGLPTADLRTGSPSDLRLASTVCPFAAEAPSPDDIADRVFSTAPHQDPVLGRYVSVHAGRVTDRDRLVGSSSGGLTSWLLTRMLRDGMVDAVVHVGPAADGDALFGYTVSNTVDELLKRRKSMYYAASFAEAVSAITATDLTYAFVGVPCQVRAMRALALQVPAIADRVKYHVGLVCGHMKGPGFAASLAWQLGVGPTDLAEVDFRVKLADREVGDYGFAARSRDGVRVEAPVADLLGSSWGHAMFSPEACNVCDDIFAESADIAFGDAWLPRYRSQWLGTNVVVVRDPVLRDLLEHGVADGEVEIDAIDADDVVSSQAGNVRHRRIGASVRLADDVAAGRWVPPARVPASTSGVPWSRRLLIRLRRKISSESFLAFEDARSANDLSIYLARMRRLTSRYRQIERLGLARRAIQRLARH